MKPHKPHDVGNRFVIEDCQRIDINQLIRSVREKLRPALFAADIKAAGFQLSLTTSKAKFGTRYWFKCPRCERRVGILLIHPLTQGVGCRKCLNLEYRKRRYKGMAELASSLKLRAL